jgi:hypothetical protein
VSSKRFSSEVSITSAATPAELADLNTAQVNTRAVTNHELGNRMAAMQAQIDSDNKDYLDMLNDTEAR